MIVFSYSLGVFCFDEHLSLKEKLEFNKNESIRYAEELNQGMDIHPEKKLRQKYPDSRKPTEKEMENILSILATPECIKKLREINLIITEHRLRESVNPDQFIINTINNIEELNKVCNTLAKRVREWYSLYLPELSEQVGDNEAFVRLACSKSKEELKKELRVQESIGAHISKEDIEPILELGKKILELYKERDALEQYLGKTMEGYCRNVNTVAGSLIGAKLLRGLGSLKRMAITPSTTIQLLGAEKALFRHLRDKSIRPPKHGHIINHPIVQTAPPADRGKAARALADKISIAARIDYFKGEFIGDTLLTELEKKFKK
ncbi:MAG: NOP5/NOP56 family protein [Nanoarchaeota archaeon]